MASSFFSSASLVASMVLGASMMVGCSGAQGDASSADEASGSAVTTASGDLDVNGHTLNAREAKWMTHVATVVVPALTAIGDGDRTARIERAAEAAWWSLKEGDFDVSNPPAYSNCTESSGDHLIGPLAICGSTEAWQVGLAGVQVTGHTPTEIEAWAASIDATKTTADWLAEAALEAGYEEGSSTYNAIVASTGQLRVSWLLRNSILGFAVVSKSEVEPECITGDDGWCYGKSWDTTALYAPTKTAAKQAIVDIETILDTLAP